eukprot:tig00020614_g12231.t1
MDRDFNGARNIMLRVASGVDDADGCAPPLDVVGAAGARTAPVPSVDMPARAPDPAPDPDPEAAGSSSAAPSPAKRQRLQF